MTGRPTNSRDRERWARARCSRTGRLGTLELLLDGQQFRSHPKSCCPSWTAYVEAMTTTSPRLPVVFLPHGGGPWPFVKLGFGSEAEQADLARHLRAVRDLPPAPPRALLVISAHWEEPRPTVMNGSRPPLLFDYYGFPAESSS